MDELKRKIRVVKPMPGRGLRSFDPLRFVEPTIVKPREEAIAELAYFRAQKRGFEPGHDVEDWLEAEAEYERNLGARR
jgi:hypothetical protein